MGGPHSHPLRPPGKPKVVVRSEQMVVATLRCQGIRNGQFVLRAECPPIRQGADDRNGYRTAIVVHQDLWSLSSYLGSE